MTISECLENMKLIGHPTHFHLSIWLWKNLKSSHQNFFFFTFLKCEGWLPLCIKTHFQSGTVCTERCQKEKYTVGDNEVNIALVVPQCSCFPTKHFLYSALDVKFNGRFKLCGFFKAVKRLCLCTEVMGSFCSWHFYSLYKHLYVNV